MLEITYTSQFRKDFKRLKKTGRYDVNQLENIIEKLSKENPLEAKHRNHLLKGNLEGFYECHICPDWLLIYEIDKPTNHLRLARTGSHSELFD